jgi:predicted PurR-regulated permease PerM
MAVEIPPRFTREPESKTDPPPPVPVRWAGDEAVPRGLAVASAVTLRLLIVAAGITVLALAAGRMLLVVMPLIIALLLTTLLGPMARWLERHRFRAAPASLVAVLTALLVFIGLWALIIPAAVDQGDQLANRVQEGLGQVTNVLKPIGVDSRDLDRAVHQGASAARHQALPVAMMAAQWAGAVVLIVVLTFFFVKDGRRIWAWILELFHERRQQALDDVGQRAWSALATYVRGVFLVATIDAVFIGAALLIAGVPMALPLIVLTFIAAFFPIVGATVAGAAAVLVALVSNGVPTALAILAVIVLVQQLEGNVFYPVVVGRKLSLHPVAILLALTAGGVIAGVAGAFLAVPVAAVTSAVLEYVRERREARPREAVLRP